MRTVGRVAQRQHQCGDKATPAACQLSNAKLNATRSALFATEAKSDMREVYFRDSTSQSLTAIAPGHLSVAGRSRRSKSVCVRLAMPEPMRSLSSRPSRKCAGWNRNPNTKPRKRGAHGEMRQAATPTLRDSGETQPWHRYDCRDRSVYGESRIFKGAFGTRHVGPKLAPATKFPAQACAAICT